MSSLSTYLEEENKRDKMVSVIVSLVFHGLLFISLLWLALTPPDPPLGEGEGMMIALGFPDQGGPDDDPAMEMPVVNVPDESTPVEEENISTQETEEAPVMETKPNEEKKKTEEKRTEKKTEEKKQTERKTDQRALFKGNNTNGNPNSEGQGDGEVPGNGGDPNGNPDGDPNGKGLGNKGDGMGRYDLAGRKVKHMPDVQDNSKAIGTVIVDITVDRNGKVIKASPGARGSTTTDITLREKAKQAALQTEFSPNPTGPAEQAGTMTFIFRYKP